MKMTASKIALLIFTLLRTSDFTAGTKSETVNLPAEPIAVVTDISGVVKLKPAHENKTKTIDSTMLLYEDDEVVMGKNGGAALFQVNLVAERLKESDKRTIKPASPPPPKGAFTREQMIQYKQLVGRASRNAKVKSPATKGHKFTALSLRFGLLLDPRPILAWTPVRGARTYVIKLYNNLNDVIWSKTTPDSWVTYDAPALVSGDYKWDVTAQTVDGKTLYDVTPFTAIATERAEQIRSELQLAREVTENIDSVNLAYVAVCLEYKQYRSAEEDLKRGLRRSPSDRVLWALLAETYQAMQRWDDREMARKFWSNPTSTTKLQGFLLDEKPR